MSKVKSQLRLNRGQKLKVSLDIGHIAKLANIPVSASEKLTLAKQLQDTLTYIEKLEEIDTTNIEPTSQVTQLENVTREDIASPSLTQEEALQNAKSTKNGFIVTNAILVDQ